jgi:hypothetical protein
LVIATPNRLVTNTRYSIQKIISDGKKKWRKHKAEVSVSELARILVYSTLKNVFLGQY